MIDLQYTFPFQNELFFKNFWESNPVDLVVLDNEIWFNFDNLSNVLELNKNEVKKHIRTLPTEWKKRILNKDKTGRIQLVSDAGLLTFTSISHLDRAKKLENWIFKDLLPDLRNQYITKTVPIKKEVQEETKPIEVEKPKVVPKVEIEDDEPMSLNIFDDEEEW